MKLVEIIFGGAGVVAALSAAFSAALSYQSTLRMEHFAVESAYRAELNNYQGWVIRAIKLGIGFDRLRGALTAECMQSIDSSKTLADLEALMSSTLPVVEGAAFLDRLNAIGMLNIEAGATVSTAEYLMETITEGCGSDR
ncbi:hypothetical protein [Falsigemmobacter faecalis]|uniref:Uncharacterized protein n=1 Tax=Falsigemmobacter faecalis TaxID=2488730 RepID=A0A3P3D6N8_9RHOB|nr:hypothetical protein [Falsigemmobacter faecalis]RRH70035.1 hypothetical protein EG244_17650 [Falsigemmobacter faecalis]